jgi:hypothetical protein
MTGIAASTDTKPDDEAPDLVRFDARYRWVIWQEMQPLHKPLVLKTRDALDQLFEKLRVRVVDTLVRNKLDVMNTDLATVKMVARTYVTAIAEQVAEALAPPQTGTTQNTSGPTAEAGPSTASDGGA